MQSSKSIRQVILISQEAKTTAWGTSTFVCHGTAEWEQELPIQEGPKNQRQGRFRGQRQPNLLYWARWSCLRAGRLVLSTWSRKPDPGRFDANKPTYRGDSLLCFEFMFEAAFWARDGAQRRLKASSLSWLKMQNGNRIWSLWQRACRDTNLAVDEAKVRLNFAVCPGDSGFQDSYNMPENKIMYMSTRS